MTGDGHGSAAGRAPLDARQWARILSRYREPNHGRSIVEIAITLLPFATLWALAWLAVYVGYWPLSLLPSILAAAFAVRLFSIQHDCGHGAFFRRRLANDWVGRAIGVLTLTPYDAWRRDHAVHHAGSGNLGRRGTGDIKTLTVREYQELSRWRRLRYRLYRNPFIMLALGSPYLFILRHRLPFGLVGGRRQAWISAMATNLAIAAIIAALIWLVGIGPFLLVQGPITVLAAAAGVWLFYVQHQFEQTVWAEDNDWSLHEAALHGSTHYDLPALLRWFTVNIGVHHVHHLCCRIPSYRLGRVLRDHPELRNVSRLNLIESLGCFRLALWDETQRRLVSFREARTG
jgi:omega-6 fatty acid desaturase (delta-12 desaturase)